MPSSRWSIRGGCCRPRCRCRARRSPPTSASPTRCWRATRASIPSVIGTSSARLLRPPVLNEAFGGRFANLSMNSGTAWEQSELLALFTRSHPAPRTVLIGLDMVWCESGPLRRLTPRPFPDWMYGREPVARLRRDPEPLRRRGSRQAGAGDARAWRRARYGRDGWADFLPDDALYDAAARRRRPGAADIRARARRHAGLRLPAARAAGRTPGRAAGRHAGAAVPGALSCLAAAAARHARGAALGRLPATPSPPSPARGPAPSWPIS